MFCIWFLVIATAVTVLLKLITMPDRRKCCWQSHISFLSHQVLHPSVIKVNHVNTYLAYLSILVLRLLALVFSTLLLWPPLQNVAPTVSSILSEQTMSTKQNEGETSDMVLSTYRSCRIFPIDISRKSCVCSRVCRRCDQFTRSHHIRVPLQLKGVIIREFLCQCVCYIRCFLHLSSSENIGTISLHWIWKCK